MTGIVKGIFGLGAGEKPLTGFRPAGFSAPGASGSFSGNSFNVSRTAAGNSAVQGVQNEFLRRSESLRALLPQVAPGFGRLTEARVNSIREARGRSVGNLREDLRRRRVLGSRFAQISTQAEEAKFAQLESEARATSFLQELDMTTKIISDETQASISAASAVLSQLNFETGVAAQLGQAASGALQANAVALAQIKQASENNALDILGTIAGFALGGIGGKKPPSPSAGPVGAHPIFGPL